MSRQQQGGPTAAEIPEADEGKAVRIVARERQKGCDFDEVKRAPTEGHANNW
jgi:hypothetical protein